MSDEHHEILGLLGARVHGMDPLGLFEVGCIILEQAVFDHD